MAELRRRMSVQGGVLASLKEYDAYSKPMDDFRVKTATGASLTLLSAAIILLLVFSEFIDWAQIDKVPSLVVDSKRKEKMKVHMDITFPHLPCFILSVDVMDVAGEHQNDVDHDVIKTRIDPTGVVIQKSKGGM